MGQLALDLRESPLKRTCDYCGAALVPSGGTTGGGVNDAGETLCFACCGFADAIAMVGTEPGERGTVGLYVAGEVVRGGDASMASERDKVGAALTVTNWPGTLKLQVTAATRWVRGGGCAPTKRRTVYFRGPRGSWWSGVQYDGNAGEFLRNVRRLKS